MNAQELITWAERQKGADGKVDWQNVCHSLLGASEQVVGDLVRLVNLRGTANFAAIGVFQNVIVCTKYLLEKENEASQKSE